MSTNKHLRRAEQRAAKALAAEKNIGYAQAVEELRNSADTLVRSAESAASTKLSSPAEPTEQDYRDKLKRLCEYAEAWERSMDDDEDDEPDGACEQQMITAASSVLTGLRDDGHKRRVKQDMVEVCRSELRTFAQHVDSYEELGFAYEMSPTHSRYEAQEELASALRSAQRFLTRADDPEFRAHFTHEVNPLYQAEKIPVPVPDPNGERVCGVRQGAIMRDLDTGELRTLLTGPQSEGRFGSTVRLSDPRDEDEPAPGESSVFGGFWYAADQLLMFCEPVDPNDVEESVASSVTVG